MKIKHMKDNNRDIYFTYLLSTTWLSRNKFNYKNYKKKFAPFAIHFVSYENEINDLDDFFNQHF